MPLFLFHLHTRDGLDRDDLGVEFESLAPLIPPDMEAGDAANEFVSVYAQGMKDGRRKPPKWCRG